MRHFYHQAANEDKLQYLVNNDHFYCKRVGLLLHKFSTQQESIYTGIQLQLAEASKTLFYKQSISRIMINIGTFLNLE